MTVRFFAHTKSKRAEALALVDSGATENFMNLDYAHYLVTIRNHAYQKLFSFVVTRPSSLLPLPPTRICDRHVVKLHILKPFPFLRNDWHVVKLHNT
jgi:hypothetical protein